MKTADRQDYDIYLKNVRISENAMRTAVMEAKDEGKIEGKIEMILALFDIGVSLAQLSSASQLSEEEVVKILRSHGKMK